MKLNLICKLFIIILVSLVVLFKIKFTRSLKSEITFRGEKIFIHRDKYSIPHIKSPNLQATLYGLGYVFAQDRLFQMHLRRTITSGRLSQMVGTKPVQLDKFFREIGLGFWAEQTANRIKKQDPEFYSLLEIFSQGINDEVKENGVPLQFYLLRTSFQQWNVKDCVLVYKLLQWSMAFNIEDQYLRTLLLQNMTKQQAKILYPYDIDNYYLNHSNAATISDQQLRQNNLFEDFSQKQKKLEKFSPQHLHNMIEIGLNQYLNAIPVVDGSNIWVISGKYTQNGQPFIASDSHFQNTIPTEWYPVSFQYKNNQKIQKFKGHIIAGAPGMAIGKSPYFTWGMTNTKADIQDLYLEKIEGDKYFFEGEWRQLKSRQEIIKVKGQPDIIYNVKSTHRGPVLSRLFARGFPYLFNDTMSLAWTGHNSEFIHIKTLTYFHQISNHKKIMEELVEGLNYAANTNIVYITTDNHLGYCMNGRLPIRSDQESGAFVKDGTISQYDWKGFLKDKQRPFIQDPQRGYIVNSNNKPGSQNYLGGIFRYSVVPTARANRLQQLIKNKIDNNEKFTTQDMINFQLDTVDVYCREVLPHIFNHLPKMNVYLSNWQCNFNKQSYQATIYEVFLNHLKRKLKNTSLLIENTFVFDHYIYRYLSGNIENKKVNIGYLQKALEQTLTFLQERYKDKNFKNWKWGIIHKDFMTYRLFSESPLRSLFQKTKQGKGNVNTINLGLMSRLSEDNYNAIQKPKMRMISSYAENSSWWLIDTGVSESFLSDNYADQLELFEKDQYIKFELNHQDSTSNQHQL